jgi:hypothetical protein
MEISHFFVRCVAAYIFFILCPPKQTQRPPINNLVAEETLPCALHARQSFFKPRDFIVISTNRGLSCIVSDKYASSQYVSFLLFLPSHGLRFCPSSIPRDGTGGNPMLFPCFLELIRGRYNRYWTIDGLGILL